MKTQVWAHRGASGWDKQYAPENTMPAFIKACEMGADGIELDVQLTKDGEIVIIHDETVDRVSNGTGWVKDYTLNEIRKLNFAKLHPEYGFTTIPTLQELFQFMSKNKILINIELKTGLIFYPRLEEKVLELVEKMNMSSRIIYSSFNHYSLKKIDELTHGEARTGILLCEQLVDIANYAKKLGACAVHIPMNVVKHPGFIDECQKNNLKIHVWTVDNKMDMKKLCRLGVDAFITDCPDSGRKIVDGVS